MTRLICIVALTLAGLMIVGCSNNGSGQLFTNSSTEGPVLLAGKGKANETLLGGGLASLKREIDQPDLKKAIHRYRLSRSIMSGASQIIGVDLNGDGLGEALVYFEGDQWCISTGCEMAVFVKGANGFRRMSVIKRVKAPIAIGQESSEGWRDLYARSGNQSIGERIVRLRFRGNYPANATMVNEKLAELPPGHETLISATSTLSDAQ